MEALLAAVAAAKQGSNAAAAPSAGGGGGSASASSLAFDAGQAYQRAVIEYSSAISTLELAQAAQQKQDSLSKGPANAPIVIDDDKKKTSAEQAVSWKMGVPEPQIAEQWQKDVENIAAYQKAQTQQKDGESSARSSAEPVRPCSQAEGEGNAHKVGSHRHLPCAYWNHGDFRTDHSPPPQRGIEASSSFAVQGAGQGGTSRQTASASWPASASQADLSAPATGPNIREGWYAP